MYVGSVLLFAILVQFLYKSGEEAAKWMNENLDELL